MKNTADLRSRCCTKTCDGVGAYGQVFNGNDREGCCQEIEEANRRDAAKIHIADAVAGNQDAEQPAACH
jgi:hypothetical protein